MPRAPRTIYQRYEVGERIAVGGMAEVYLAKAYGAHGFEKTLALKRILRELAESREFEERFIAEAKLSVKLTHTNIVQVFDFGWVEDWLFLAMEYVDGIDLATLFSYCRASGQRVPLAAAFHIAIELVRGLDFAHSQDVIHRDVSPSNILLSKAGEVKIADFGIAVPVTHTIAKSSQRRIMGKWRYMSPEQTRGDELDTRSDIFSAAAVMYELFVGTKLFRGDTIDEIVASIHSMDIPKATEARPELPARLDEVLGAALAHDRDKRLGPAAEIQRLLTEMSYQNSIVATALAVKELVTTATSAATALLSDSNSSAPARSRRKPTLDEFIRAQLGGTAVGELRPVTERHTVRDAAVHSEPDDSEPDDSGVVAQDPGLQGGNAQAGVGTADDDSYRPATIVRTQVEHKGMSVWEQVRKPRRPVLARAVAALGAVAVLVLAAVLWVSASSPEPGALILPEAIDAGVQPVPNMAVVRVSSQPPGASIKLDTRAHFQPTPAALFVTSDQTYVIEVSQSGYMPYLALVSLSAGEVKEVHAELTPVPASLRVNTEPEGAHVTLNGVHQGTTPLALESSIVGTARVEVYLEGYAPASKTIELVPGEYESVKLVLEPKGLPLPAPRPIPRPVPMEYGTIDLVMEKGWAEIFVKGKSFGVAPVRGLKLPLGKHRLRLYNNVTKQEKYLKVEVLAQGINRYNISL